ncbi:GNAT family N-acetyltransferase [Mesorhizobium sp. NBSH29]|uniref:GNAT family N-acetyltransferase n=1 Tax=Mesorhizobium sp. NBSH29 TaxID=2654249 RepID=UPI0018969035|nr:GNAT family N-acetyltransferase [Mesorhizobium sp. NBSH29]QPC85583.1 GNAT family N-acetyltransferase [Mesorhizobium sp. NBSH29]
MTNSLEVTQTPGADDLAHLGAQLSAFNDGDVGPAGRVALCVLVRDEAGVIVAGISGYTAWGWLYIQWLWVDEALRGQKIAGRMLDAAETEAVQRGCHGSYIDTFNHLALKVYQRQGYHPFGALENFPLGRTRTFLSKKLTDSAAG